MILARLANTLRNTVSRAKVTEAAIGPRTVLQLTGLDNEAFQSVELLLPPGYSAAPVAGADVALFQVLGQRDHKIALGGDNAAGDAIADLAAGEFGLRNAAAGTQIVMRNTGTVEITALVVLINGELRATGDVIANTGTAQVSLINHQHGGVAVGDVQTTAPIPGT